MSPSILAVLLSQLPFIRSCYFVPRNALFLFRSPIATFAQADPSAVEEVRSCLR
jgi:hypothetical protein